MHGNQFSDSGERMCVRKDVSPEYFFVAALPLYKNVTDAKLASCKAARNLAKHRRFYKGSSRNIPGWHPLWQYSFHRNPKINFRVSKKNCLFFKIMLYYYWWVLPLSGSCKSVRTALGGDSAMWLCFGHSHIYLLVWWFYCEVYSCGQGARRACLHIHLEGGF